jgi:CBS domain-containing protein
MTTETTRSSYGLDAVTVEQAMHPGVLTCAPETPLREVAIAMARYRIHAVVVYAEPEESDEATLVWGVVSDADLVGAAALNDVDGRTAGQAARTPLVTVRREDTLRHACELMTERDVTHAVVISSYSERPLGVVSALDVARALALEPRTSHQ